MFLLPRAIWAIPFIIGSILTGGSEEGTWKEVKSLKLRTGTIRVGMWEQDFNKATGRRPLGMVVPSKFPNYTYNHALSGAPFINYDTWTRYVVGDKDFEVQWRRYRRGKNGLASNSEKIIAIKVWTGTPHPNPSGQLNSPY